MNFRMDVENKNESENDDLLFSLSLSHYYVIEQLEGVMMDALLLVLVLVLVFVFVFLDTRHDTQHYSVHYFRNGTIVVAITFALPVLQWMEYRC